MTHSGQKSPPGPGLGFGIFPGFLAGHVPAFPVGYIPQHMNYPWSVLQSPVGDYPYLIVTEAPARHYESLFRDVPYLTAFQSSYSLFFQYFSHFCREQSFQQPTGCGYFGKPYH